MRLCNVNSGAVVSCDEATAKRLGAEWEPAEKPKARQVKSSQGDKS